MIAKGDFGVCDQTRHAGPEVSVLEGSRGGETWHSEGDWEKKDPGHRFRLFAVVEEEDGLFISSTPSLPGAASQGRSLEEALDRLREAAAGCILSYRDAGQEIPWEHDPAPEGEDAVTYKGWIDVDVQ